MWARWAGWVGGLALGSAQAALVIDQAQLNPDRLLASGGVSGPAMQAFVPTFGNVAGVDLLLLGTGALEASASISLERVRFEPGRVLRQDGMGNQFEVLGYFTDVQVLATASLAGLPRSDRADALAQFRWAPVAVTPGETLFLRVNSTGLGLGTFGGVEAYGPTNVLSVFTLGDPINGLRTVANGAFYTGVSQGSYDLVFRTYAEVSPVPEAHALALALAGVGVAVGAARQRARRPA